MSIPLVKVPVTDLKFEDIVFLPDDGKFYLIDSNTADNIGTDECPVWVNELIVNTMTFSLYTDISGSPSSAELDKMTDEVDCWSNIRQHVMFWGVA